MLQRFAMKNTQSTSLIDLADAIDNIDKALSVLIKTNREYLCKSIILSICESNEKLIDQICSAEGESFTKSNRYLLLNKAINIREKISIMKEISSINSAA